MVRLAMVLRVGLRLQPGPHVGRLGGRIVEPGVEQQRRLDLALDHGMDRRGRVERAQPRLQRRAARGIGEVALGQEEAVGDGGLLYGFPVAVEGRRADRRTDRGDQDRQDDLWGKREYYREDYGRRRS